MSDVPNVYSTAVGGRTWDSAEAQGCRRAGWITNSPGPFKGYWPRRAGVLYKEGPPCPTRECSRADLEKINYIGIYIVGDRPDDYFKRDLLAGDGYWATVPIEVDGEMRSAKCTSCGYRASLDGEDAALTIAAIGLCESCTDEQEKWEEYHKATS